MNDALNSLYRKLPQIGELLESSAGAELLRIYSRELVTDAARSVLARAREEIRSGGHSEASLQSWRSRLSNAIEEQLQRYLRPSLRRVINATGVILQTNLGRAPLSEAAIRQITEVARGYCNLEMDLDSGERDQRDERVESLILDVLALRSGAPTGSLVERRAAAVVNNCAAATFLALNTLAEGGDVIVSRGELVEIGGGFRIPEILRKSGALMREVGTTNRTRVEDYAAAITQQTKLILRVHRSNFRMDGFTEQPTIEELIALGQKSAVPVFEDQGTGCVVALEEFGLQDESSWVGSAAGAAALTAASGDKLLGGPQCGILVGDRAVIERIRANPLYRALRVDKLTYAALQATLQAYLSREDDSIPAIAMMRMRAEQIRGRCEACVAGLERTGWNAEIIATRSVVGGGTTPGATLPSFAVALRHDSLTESAVAKRLRGSEPAIVARTSEGRVVLDLRTVFPADDAVVLEVLRSLHGKVAGTERMGVEGARL